MPPILGSFTTEVTTRAEIGPEGFVMPTLLARVCAGVVLACWAVGWLAGYPLEGISVGVAVCAAGIWIFGSSQ
jgi:hypothetical protein